MPETDRIVKNSVLDQARMELQIAQDNLRHARYEVAKHACWLKYLERDCAPVDDA